MRPNLSVIYEEFVDLCVKQTKVLFKEVCRDLIAKIAAGGIDNDEDDDVAAH